MEKKSRCCANCHQTFTPSRNLKQKYCGQNICQNARKHSWRKQKHADDADYRQNQQRANKSWQQRHPDYWRQYRKTHPNYTRQNREQQLIRDRQRSQNVCKSNASLLAKSDALAVMKPLSTPVKSGTYHLIPVTRHTLAKSDALTVEISLISIC